MKSNLLLTTLLLVLMVGNISCSRVSPLRGNPNSNYVRVPDNAKDVWFHHGAKAIRYAISDGESHFEEYEVSRPLSGMLTINDRLIVGFKSDYSDFVSEHVLYAGIRDSEAKTIKLAEFDRMKTKSSDPMLLTLDDESICFISSTGNIDSLVEELELVHGKILLSEEVEFDRFDRMDSFVKRIFCYQLPPRLMTTALKSHLILTSQESMNEFSLTVFSIEPQGKLIPFEIANYERQIDSPTFVGANISEDGKTMVTCEYCNNSSTDPRKSEIAVSISRLSHWEVQEQLSYRWQFANWGGFGNYFTDCPIRIIGSEVAIVATPEGWVQIDLRYAWGNAPKPELILQTYATTPQRLHRESPPDFRGFLQAQNPKKLLIVQKYMDSKDAILEITERDSKKRVLK